LFAASVALIATFGIAACGGDDDDDAAATDPTTLDSAAATTPEDTSDVTLSVDDTSGSTPTDGTGGGEVGTQDEYVEAAAEGFPIQDEELDGCIAEAMITDDVYAAIEESGVTTDAFRDSGPAGAGIVLDEAQANEVADGMAACGDLIGEVLSGNESCATDVLSNEQIAQYISFTLFSVEPSAELQSAYDAVETCLAETATTTTG
jgi:hypothetical protein